MVDVGVKPVQEPAEYYSYKLVGVVVHSGNAESGHYYSFIDSNREESEGQADFMSPEKDKWLEFNDSLVKDFDFKRIPLECFGGSTEDTALMHDIGEGRSRSAYMLIYERRLKTPILELVPATCELKEGRDVVLSSLAEYETQKTKGKSLFYKDPATGEMFALHNFHRVPQRPCEKAVEVYNISSLMLKQKFRW